MFATGQRVVWLGEDGPIGGTVVETTPFTAWIDWDDASFGIYDHDSGDVELAEESAVS